MPKFAQLYNRTQFNVNTKDFNFVKLSELYAKEPQKIYTLNGLWINTGKFGKQPVFIVENEKILVNVPPHLTETATAILSDLDACEDISNKKVGFTIYQYTTQNKVCYSVRFVDL